MSTIRLRPLTAGSPAHARAPGREQTPGQRRARAWTIGLSVLLHAMAIVALLLMPKRDEDDSGAAPAYELMFEGGQTPPAPTPGAAPDAPTAPQTAPALEPAPPESSPPPAPPVPDTLPAPQSAPLAPPVPDAPALPPAPPETPAPPTPQPEPQPAPEIAQPAPPAPTQAPPAPAPPAEAPIAPGPSSDVQVTPEPAPLPPPSRPPDVRLEVPQPEAPPPPMLPDLVLPTPPAPPPRPPPPPPRPRSAPPAAPPGTLANPMDLDFHPAQPRLAAPRSTAPRGSVASRSLDLSPGTPKGPNRSDVFFDYRAAKLGADWRDVLMSYWLNHRYYPRQAAEAGDDGSADVELTVDASGRVTNAVLKSRTGSPFLDMAAVSTWRGAKLNPLPPELAPSYTFSITINYILLR